MIGGGLLDRNGLISGAGFSVSMDFDVSLMMLGPIEGCGDCSQNVSRKADRPQRGIEAVMPGHQLG